MTAAEKERAYLSPAEYLEGELSSEIRHEYVEGQVYAMAGSSDDHNRIVANLARELGLALRGRRCEPFFNDMKIKMPPSFGEVFYYPDVTVSCDATDTSKYFRERPSVIMEVLSESTRTTDEREKTLAYHHLESLKAYVLIEQEQLKITVLHRLEAGWRREVLSGFDAVLDLACIAARIPFAAIYERTSILKKGAM